MNAFQKQIFPTGEDKSTYLQDDSRASRSALQGSEKERKITAISGHRCSVQYERYDQLGLLVKMLLESSRWFSPERRLKWDSNPLFLERMTEKEYCTGKNTLSKPSAEILRVKDIQSSRLLFRLVPSEHRTGETGCGLLPTPMSTEVRHQKRVQELKAAGGNTFHSRANGETQPNGLMYFIEFHVMLITPSSTDGIRANFTMESLTKHKKKYAESSNLAEQIAHKVGGGTSQLNPRFVAEMMGFPPDWTELPFLNGGKNP